MKTSITIIVLLMGIIGAVINHDATAQDSYYYGLGQQPLWQCDSVITVKFDPAIPQQYYQNFSSEIEAINEFYPPKPFFGGFDIYHVESGHNIDSLLDVIRNEPEVLLAYPAYLDSFGLLIEIGDRIVLKYKETTSSFSIDNIESFYFLETAQPPNPHTGMKVLRTTSSSPGTSLQIANLLFESGITEYSHPDLSETILYDFIPDDPLFTYQYHMHNEGQTGGTVGIDINASKAWQLTKGDENVPIGIIDAGFTRYHEDISLYEYPGGWVYGYDFVGHEVKNPQPDEDPTAGPQSAHGIACEGIILAQNNNGVGVAGLATMCDFLPIKGGDDFENMAPSSIMHDALLYGVDMGALVISCSWGWPYWLYFSEIVDAVNYAAAQNRVLVFASGNYGAGYNAVAFPANQENVIAVGSIKKDGGHWNYSGRGEQLDVVAPSGFMGDYEAGDIYTLDGPGLLGWNPAYVTCAQTTNDYLCTFGGTSAAAPQVAGTIGLLLSYQYKRYGAWPYSGLTSIRDILINSARDQIGDQYDTPGFDNYYGHGLASAYRALLSISRGDVNADGEMNIIDVIYLINYKFKEGVEPIPEKSMGDVDCDGMISVLDCLYLLNHVLKGGPAPQTCFNYDLLE